MTDEEKKLILEWCGFKLSYYCLKGERQGLALHYSEYPDGTQLRNGIPPLDLNFYFKYVVPKLKYLSLHYDSKLKYLVCLDGGEDVGVSTEDDKCPAEAFGQALLKLIREE